jgi:hypothetical protein
MNAPKIHRIGKKIPKKNIQPCPFRSVLRPSHTKRMNQSSAPKPIPHYMVASSASLTEPPRTLLPPNRPLIGHIG